MCSSDLGRVWCNPPYGDQTKHWLAKCATHGNCTALVFARTETKQFFDHVWPKAKGMLFIKGRVKFCHVSGKTGGPAGAPSVLIAFDHVNANILRNSTIQGKFVSLNEC